MQRYGKSVKMQNFFTLIIIKRGDNRFAADIRFMQDKRKLNHDFLFFCFVFYVICITFALFLDRIS